MTRESDWTFISRAFGLPPLDERIIGLLASGDRRQRRRGERLAWRSGCYAAYRQAVLALALWRGVAAMERASVDFAKTMLKGAEQAARSINALAAPLNGEQA